MGQTADQLRQEIDQRREDAAQKIGEIETRAQDTAQTAKDTVDQTVRAARNTVDQTVQTVKQSVDIRQQVQERPLVALGAAMIGGFVLGGLIGGDDDEEYRYRSERGAGGHMQPYVGRRQDGIASGIRSAAKSSGLEDQLTNVAAALLGTLTEQLRSTVDQSFPGFADKLQSVQQTPGGFGEKRQAAMQGDSGAGSARARTAGTAPE